MPSPAHHQVDVFEVLQKRATRAFGTVVATIASATGLSSAECEAALAELKVAGLVQEKYLGSFTLVEGACLPENLVEQAVYSRARTMVGEVAAATLGGCSVSSRPLSRPLLAKGSLSGYSNERQIEKRASLPSFKALDEAIAEALQLAAGPMTITEITRAVGDARALGLCGDTRDKGKIRQRLKKSPQLVPHVICDVSCIPHEFTFKGPGSLSGGSAVLDLQTTNPEERDWLERIAQSPQVRTVAELASCRFWPLVEKVQVKDDQKASFLAAFRSLKRQARNLSGHSGLPELVRTVAPSALLSSLGIPYGLRDSFAALQEKGIETVLQFALLERARVAGVAASSNKHRDVLELMHRRAVLLCSCSPLTSTLDGVRWPAPPAPTTLLYSANSAPPRWLLKTVLLIGRQFGAQSLAEFGALSAVDVWGCGALSRTSLLGVWQFHEFAMVVKTIAPEADRPAAEDSPVGTRRASRRQRVDPEYKSVTDSREELRALLNEILP